jgi:RNA polymerase sigma-70 factor (ECF subfamily)
VSGTQIPSGSIESTALTAAAIRAGDEEAFNHLAGRHRRELLIHCYRMLGSLDDAEDAVQDALLRAWRYRESLIEGAPLRPWLYRVATNVCLDAIARDERRSVLAAKSVENGAPPSTDEVLWLQPIPDSLIEPISQHDADPETIVLSRETIEIAFLTVIQCLTPQQRAALILCDVLGWSAKEAAGLLDVSTAAVNSALQRARVTLQRRLPSRRPEWPPGEDPSVAERELLKKIVDASEKADLEAFTSIIRDDVIFRMPPQPDIVVGRDPPVSSASGAVDRAHRVSWADILVPDSEDMDLHREHLLQAGPTTYSGLDLIEAQRETHNETNERNGATPRCSGPRNGATGGPGQHCRVGES